MSVPGAIDSPSSTGAHTALNTRGSARLMGNGCGVFGSYGVIVAASTFGQAAKIAQLQMVGVQPSRCRFNRNAALA